MGVAARALVGVLTVLTAIGAFAPVSTLASPSVKLSASFKPNRLGAGTTIGLGFKVKTTPPAMPSPLLSMDFRLPAGVSLSSSELGLETCTLAALQAGGAPACSPNAVMGHGKATILAPDGPFVLSEPVKLTVVMSPAVDRHTSLLFYADGISPVIAQLLFPGAILSDSAPFGGDLHANIPLTPGFPGEPAATVISMQTTIGPMGVTYYRNVRKVTRPFAPRGVIVPAHCPAGGFPFAARFSFQDGSTASAATSVPCPPRSRHGRRR